MGESKMDEGQSQSLTRSTEQRKNEYIGALGGSKEFNVDVVEEGKTVSLNVDKQISNCETRTFQVPLRPTSICNLVGQIGKTIAVSA